MHDTFALQMFDGRLTVRCDDPDMAGWLREVLQPGFAVGEPRSDDVSLVIADHEGAAPTEVETEARSVPCFVLDDQVIHLPGRGTGASMVVDDDGFGARYSVTARQVQLSAARSDPQLRLPALRVVRELLTIDAMSSDVIQLHASAIATDSGVVVFAGPKEAGKTTVLAHLASSTGVSIVANDRVMLRREASGCQARGVPTIVRVRADTMARLAPLFADWQGGGGWADGQMRNLPAFARTVGVPLAAGGPVVCVALLAMRADVDAFAVRPLSVLEAARGIAMARFGIGTEPRQPTVFELALDRAEAPSVTAGLIGALAGAVPCVELTLGPALLETPAAAHDLLGALT